MVDKPFLYPNVTSVPGTKIDPSERVQKKQDGVKSDFDHVYDEKLGKADQPGISAKQPGPGALKGSTSENTSSLGKGLDSVKQPLKFSAHAAQRLQERKISLDSDTMIKINEAIDKAQAKGVEDTLVLTSQAALIVNVPNRTVVTAMDKASMNGNVFTNIDGAVIVS